MDRQGGDRYAVLFVDDEAMALEAFDMACGDSFPVLTASNAVEAARILESRSNDIAVLISDQRMPQTTGVDLLKETRRRHPHITRMLTTAYADFDATVAALNEAEIFRCIPKPWDVAALRRELAAAMEHFLARRRAEGDQPGDEQDAALQVAAPVAHKLRDTLIAMTWGVDGLRRHLPPLLEAYDDAADGRENPSVARASRRDALDTILDKLEHQTRDVSQLMELMLAQRRGAKAASAAHSMAEAVEQALERFPFAPGQRALVRTELLDDFQFSGAMPLMTRLIFNLLSNALHAVETAKKGRIEIRLETRAAGNRLCVWDGGTGIAPEILPRLFEEAVTTRADTEGHGLGLGFCRLVAETMGGSIACRSVEGEFAEFVVTLPPNTH